MDDRKQFLLILVKSLIKAALKTVPGGAGIEQIGFGTAEMFENEETKRILNELEVGQDTINETLSILKEISEIFSPKIVSELSSIRDSQDKLDVVIQSLFSENRHETDKLEQKLTQLNDLIITVLLMHIHQLSKNDAISTRELEEKMNGINDRLLISQDMDIDDNVFPDTVQSILSEIHRTNERLKRPYSDNAPYLAKTITESIPSRDLEILSENFSVVDTAGKSLLSLMNYDTNLLGKKYTFSLDFSEIYNFVHATHIPPDKRSLASEYFVDTYDGKFIILPGSRVELFEHLDRTARSLAEFLITPDYLDQISLYTVIPELSNSEESQMSKFTEFIQKKMISLEQMGLNILPDGEIYKDLLDYLNNSRPDVPLNNEHDALDLGILTNLMNYPNQLQTMALDNWYHVTSSSRLLRYYSERMVTNSRLDYTKQQNAFKMLNFELATLLWILKQHDSTEKEKIRKLETAKNLCGLILGIIEQIGTLQRRYSRYLFSSSRGIVKELEKDVQIAIPGIDKLGSSIDLFLSDKDNIFFREYIEHINVNKNNRKYARREFSSLDYLTFEKICERTIGRLLSLSTFIRNMN
ncbi:hypothetical protein ACFLXY_10185 [Chloroflexota bacterium]